MILRRVLALAVAAMLAMGACGCASSSSSGAAEQQQEAVLSNTNIGASLEYEGKQVKLVRARVCETEVEYEYKDYVMLIFNVSELTDKERHFFEKDTYTRLSVFGKDATTSSASADHEKTGTVGDYCYVLFEYPHLETARESIEGKDLDVVVKDGVSKYAKELCHARCTVDDVETHDEFLVVATKLGYSHFNIYGYLKR